MNIAPEMREVRAAAAKDTSRLRVISIDALRGFDMFWILGGDLFMTALGRTSENPLAQGLSRQLQHADWAGFRFYDLIFPLFVFVVGVSLTFSLRRVIDQEGAVAARGKVLRRFALLFLVGLFYSGGVSQPWPEIRLMGVLNRIALCYLFAGLLFCQFRGRGLAVTAVGLLVGYWAAMTFIPFADGLRGVFEPGRNLANAIDAQYLPGKKWDGSWDPEGLLSTLPAVATCLIGVLSGLLLQSPNMDETRKIRILFAVGAGMVAAGWLWHLQFPVIKKIWTSSFVLVAGGYSALLLATFHYLT